MVAFFASNLGWISKAVVCVASLHGAHDLITGLYCDRSSLVCAVIFTLTHDGAGCFTVLLGQQSVPCLLPNIWGSSMTILVIFDLTMTSQKVDYCMRKKASCHVTPPPSMNPPWEISQDIANLMGQERILVGSHTLT